MKRISTSPCKFHYADDRRARAAARWVPISHPSLHPARAPSRMGMPHKMKAYPSFDAFQADQPPKTRAILRALRKLVREEAPELVESVKWGNGCWIGEAGPVALAHVEPDHVQFGFFAGSSLSDPNGLLEGKGKFVRHTKVRSAATMDRAGLAQLVREAAGLERPASKAARRSPRNPARRS